MLPPLNQGEDFSKDSRKSQSGRYSSLKDERLRGGESDLDGGVCLHEVGLYALFTEIAICQH